MRKMFLLLSQINEVKEFVNIVSKLPWELYLQRNEYVVDAKSLMGLFSLDLSKPVAFISTQDIPEEIYNELKKFSVDKE